MGRYFGIAAVNLIDKKEWGKLVCFKDGKITSVPIVNVLGHLNLVMYRLCTIPSGITVTVIYYNWIRRKINESGNIT